MDIRMFGLISPLNLVGSFGLHISQCLAVSQSMGFGVENSLSLGVLQTVHIWACPYGGDGCVHSHTFVPLLPLLTRANEIWYQVDLLCKRKIIARSDHPNPHLTR